eukprot:CAMPEP_0118919674 /NCGR_PEP_ID=MMETSP1166-20130328/18678_1 /TAXON_ID=1104430 /ORGANISM="Chrysoreinhardia sp, Strain CCMP3193" /LENGTH=235 /DNA_ID=CAMNT_0006860203 /DNA_START=47 /DNA_END=754 /DNA_ORIENTATION=-
MRALLLPLAVVAARSRGRRLGGLLESGCDPGSCCYYMRMQCASPWLAVDCDETCAVCAPFHEEDWPFDDDDVCEANPDVDLFCRDDVLTEVNCSTGTAVGQFPDGMCLSFTVPCSDDLDDTLLFNDTFDDDDGDGDDSGVTTTTDDRATKSTKKKKQRPKDDDTEGLTVVAAIVVVAVALSAAAITRYLYDRSVLRRAAADAILRSMDPPSVELSEESHTYRPVEPTEPRSGGFI